MMNFEYFSLTDPGLVRDNNEDSVALDPDHQVAVLADGMGGYNAGEVASAMATTFVKTELGRWLQEGGVSRLILSGPLGVAATSFYSDGRSLVIRQGEDVTTWDLQSETAILERETGWDLPLLALPYWIKGMPAPDLDVQGSEPGPDPALLHMLRQDGWEIQYESYADYGRLTLPTRLQLRHNDSTLRLVIRDWQVTPD